MSAPPPPFSDVPESDAGRVYAICSMLIGGAIYGYIIGSITTVVGLLACRSTRSARRRALHRFVVERPGPQVPRHLYRQVCSSVDAHRKAYYDRMDLIQAGLPWRISSGM